MKLYCDRHICYFCGVKDPAPKSGKKFRRLVEVHHITEKNEGGSNEACNLVPCCSNCHSLVHLEEIKIDAWLNFSYCKKLHWWDREGKEQYGPKEPTR